MENKAKKKIPTDKKDYKVKIVFKEESIVDINKIMKECFLMSLKNQEL